MLRPILVYTSGFLSLLLLVAILAKIRPPKWVNWAVATSGFLVFLALPIINPPANTDLRIFYSAGVAVWEGNDPYTDKLVLNPPFTLPLFALLALSPFEVLKWCWTAFNLVGCCALVTLAGRVLKAQEPQAEWNLEASILAVLSAVVVMSFASRYGFALGQLSVFTTVALYIALLAQGVNRPACAGVGLALGAAKTGTMIPFLLLFLRKTDLKTWLLGGILGIVLCFAAGPPQHLIERTGNCLENIRTQGSPAGVNDYSYANRSAAEIIALDHALYRLGLRDRRLIQKTQLVILLIIGIWVGWQVVRRLNRAAACSLVCFYSSLFLYHRIYDMIILAMPLVYCTAQALSKKRRLRWFYVYFVFSVVAVLYFRVGAIRELSDFTAHNHGIANFLVQAMVLPYPVWLIVSAIFLLPLAETCGERKNSAITRLVP